MPPTHANDVALTAYVSPEDALRIRELARSQDRTVAAELRRAIRAHLKAADAGGGTSGP